MKTLNEVIDVLTYPLADEDDGFVMMSEDDVTDALHYLMEYRAELAQNLAELGNMTEKRDCNKCLFATRSGDCRRWKCEFVDMDEAYEAWVRRNEPVRGKLIDVLRKVREEK